MNRRLARYGPMIAFLVLALFGGLAIKQSADKSARETAALTAEAFYKAQIKLCEQANKLGKETNRRSKIDVILRDSVVDFLNITRKARQGSLRDNTNRSTSDNDRRALSRYTVLVKNIREKVIYHKVPILDCLKTVIPARKLK